MAMKILYILNSTDTNGGATKSFLTLLNGISAKGVEPYLVTPNKAGLYQELSDKGYKLLCLNYRPSTYPNLKTLKDLFLFLPRLFGRRILEHLAVRRIVNFCKTNRIDLIHTNVSIITCGLSAARKLHIPHVLHFREYGDLDFNFKYYPTQQSLYRNLDFPQSYTICITKDIQQHHRLSPPNSHVIYNGIDIKPAIEKQLSQSQPFFLFAGRIEPSKDPMQVVKAYHGFLQKHPDTIFTLKIAGGISDHAYMRKLQSYIKNNALNGHINYLGARQDINQLMHDACAVIVSSKHEAFGRCLPETMLNHGLTIGRYTGGTKEQLDNGLVFCNRPIGLHYNTTKELTELMEMVTETPADFFNEMKSDAFNMVKSLYSKENCINNTYSFYCDIINNSNYEYS